MKRGAAGAGHARKAAVLATIIGVAAVASPRAHAGALEDAIEGLASPSGDTIEASIRKLGALDDPRGAPALDALCDDRLRVGADNHPYIWDSKTRDVRHPLTGALVTPAPRPLKEVEVGNEIRRVALPVLAQLQLGSPAAAVRLAAAEELSKSGSAEAGHAASPALTGEGRRAFAGRCSSPSRAPISPAPKRRRASRRWT
jgi:HEAT repeat protein